VRVCSDFVNDQLRARLDHMPEHGHDRPSLPCHTTHDPVILRAVADEVEEELRQYQSSAVALSKANRTRAGR
jgi:hypothetical protein